MLHWCVGSSDWASGVVRGSLALAFATVWLATSCSGRSIERGAESGGTAGNDAVAGRATGGKGGAAGDPGSGGVGPSSGGRVSSGGRAGTASGASSGTENAGEGGEHQGGSAGKGGTPGDGGMGGAPAGSGPCGATQSCVGSFRARPAGSTCALPLRDSEIEGGAGGAPDDDTPSYCDSTCEVIVNRECTVDDDCGQGAYCLFSMDEERDILDSRITLNYHCRTPCVADTDCDPDAVCSCRAMTQNATRLDIAFGTCEPSSCAANEDCGGLSCISPINRHQFRRWGFHCQSLEDECSGPEDCHVRPTEQCEYAQSCDYSSEAGHFTCRVVYTSDLC